MEGRDKARGPCFVPVFRTPLLLNTQHLNHVFGSIRESSDKDQPFRFSSKESSVCRMGEGGVKGRVGGSRAGGQGVEAACKDKPKGLVRGDSLGSRRAPGWSETSP